MNIWSFILSHLNQGHPCVLLAVVHSKGSSPGRQGFKMAVSQNGQLFGSIGGGIMEHKLVVLSQSLLKNDSDQIILKHQIHNKSIPTNQSGMICSGEQSIAIIPLGPALVSKIQMIKQHLQNINSDAFLHLSNKGIAIKKDMETTDLFQISQLDTPDWAFAERLIQQKTIHIIGAGHVGLALSKQMAILNYKVNIYDNRPQLNTFLQNDTAHKKIVLDYNSIDRYIPEGPDQSVVIMTFGYRDDKVVLEKLYEKSFDYIGMMGSKEKIRQLYQELKQEGIEHEAIKHVYAPIGIDISSKTPQEIAVSIAAEIIQIKNNVGK